MKAMQGGAVRYNPAYRKKPATSEKRAQRPGVVIKSFRGRVYTWSHDNKRGRGGRERAA